ncbi:hypothetical protein [Candidatus Palauibacter sp.]|uniref:hypothetical protein n=1 Tax=Candidatus Palauibacter sp. TaxID=3101350 RepID=UPI003C6F85FA
MSTVHDGGGKPGRVSEPVQVYLAPNERDRLERLRKELDTTKSNVLRRGLEALELQLSDPDRHPALSIIGIAGATRSRGDLSPDPARAHDDVLADAEIASWSSGPRREPDGNASE